jgi:hypothetical protein
MAEHFPAMNIHFPPARESELYEGMKCRATLPWAPSENDALNRPPSDGYYYFHRDAVGDQPSCTLCIGREKEGHWVVQNIVPDEGQISKIPLDTYKAILREFESHIAEPAADAVEGMTAIELSQYRSEDYFSPDAVELLHRFCATSNQGDLGSHPSDQEKWIDFLLVAFHDGKEIHCDVFGNCLRTAKWWPNEGIGRLVHEYDFAMRLLKQSGRSSKPQ